MSKFATFSIVAMCVLAGCGKDTRPPSPQPPSTVNASLGLIYGNESLTGDTIVVARMSKHVDLDDKIKGNWHYYWYVEQGDVLKVEKGSWPNANIMFMSEDSWPTDESGIRVDKGPWPYMAGKVWAFGLDTTVKPARIVSQEKRSCIQPFNRRRCIDNPAVETKIMDAVLDYMKKNNIQTSWAWELETLEDASFSGRYAVQVWNQETYKIFIVDGPMMSVSEYKEPPPHTK